MVRTGHLRWKAMKRFVIIMLVATGLFSGSSFSISNMPKIILPDTLS
jgi:hypothetical protein